MDGRAKATWKCLPGLYAVKLLKLRTGLGGVPGKLREYGLQVRAHRQLETHGYLMFKMSLEQAKLSPIRYDTKKAPRVSWS